MHMRIYNFSSVLLKKLNWSIGEKHTQSFRINSTWQGSFIRKWRPNDIINGHFTLDWKMHKVVKLWHSEWSCAIRGEWPHDFCYANDLYVSNTKFNHSIQSRCWMWESPNKCTHSQIDDILVSRKLLPSTQNSRSFPSADFGSDYQLVMVNIQMKLRRGMLGKTNRKINCKQLMNPAVQREYKRTAPKKMREIIKQPYTNIESKWENIKRAVQEASKEMMDHAQRATPVEWLTADAINLEDERRKWKSKWRDNPQAAKHHNYPCREVKRRAKKDRELYSYVSVYI